MAIKELRTQYGKSKKPVLAINAAVRREIPGGAKILDLTYKLSCQLPKMPPKQRETCNEILNELLKASDEMKDTIAKKYRLATAELPTAERKKPGRPALPKEQRRSKQVMVRLTAEEVERITEQGHQKAVAELVRGLALKALEKKE